MVLINLENNVAFEISSYWIPLCMLSCKEMAISIHVFTGAGGEIGGGTAKQMARWGARLALIDIHEGRLNEVLAKCAEIGLPSENIYSVVGDVMKQEVVTSFVDGAVQAFGTVDFLVNMSGLIYLNKLIYIYCFIYRIRVFPKHQIITKEKTVYGIRFSNLGSRWFVCSIYLLRFWLTHCCLVTPFGDTGGLTLAQIMSCCQTASIHYLNKCWLAIYRFLWHSPKTNFTLSAQDINSSNEFENDLHIFQAPMV